MRTVLDQEAIAFEEGFQAHENRKLESTNPYGKEQDNLRRAWFEGWAHAEACGGMCDG